MEKFNDQTALASYCTSKLHSQLERTQTIVAGLSAEQRKRPREDGGWSIDQILEHLATINGLYIDQIRGIDATAGTSSDWSPTLAGRFLRWTVTTPRQLRTPRVFEPEPLEASDDSLERFAATQSELVELIDRYRDVSWKNTRTASPASSLMRLNLGDCFLILADHAERHADQIERRRDAVAG